MKKTLALAPITLSSAAPSRFLAKGATNKVLMEGPDRSRPRVPGLRQGRFRPNRDSMRMQLASSSIGLSFQRRNYPAHLAHCKSIKSAFIQNFCFARGGFRNE